MNVVMVWNLVYHVYQQFQHWCKVIFTPLNLHILNMKWSIHNFISLLGFNCLVIFFIEFCQQMMLVVFIIEQFLEIWAICPLVTINYFLVIKIESISFVHAHFAISSNTCIDNLVKFLYYFGPSLCNKNHVHARIHQCLLRSIFIMFTLDEC